MHFTSVSNNSRKIIQEAALTDPFFQHTKTDARKISELHESIDGVPGRVGSLDCIDIGWRLCPMAHKGHYQGLKGFPTVVLEAVADFNLWFWHPSFGYLESLNDINIWDQSLLLKAFLDGTFTKRIDFEYEINGIAFDKLFFLVDGIYPN